MDLVGEAVMPDCCMASSVREPKDPAYAIAEDIAGLPRDAILARGAIKTYIRRDWAAFGARQALWQEMVDG